MPLGTWYRRKIYILALSRTPVEMHSTKKREQRRLIRDLLTG